MRGQHSVRCLVQSVWSRNGEGSHMSISSVQDGDLTSPSLPDWVWYALEHLRRVNGHVQRLPGIGCGYGYTGCLALHGWWQRHCCQGDTSGVLISGIGSSRGTLPVSVCRLWVAPTFHSPAEGQTGSKHCSLSLVFRLSLAWRHTVDSLAPPTHLCISWEKRPDESLPRYVKYSLGATVCP